MTNKAPIPARRTMAAISLMAGFAALSLLQGCADLEEYLRPVPAREQPPAEVLNYHPGESAIWCYETLGVPDCYSGPQGGPPNRLIDRYRDR